MAALENVGLGVDFAGFGGTLVDEYCISPEPTNPIIDAMRTNRPANDPLKYG